MFFGDLVSESRTNYVFGVAAEREYTSYLNARVDLNYGSMKGTQINEGSTLPYATFENTFIQFGVGATFRPLDYAYGLFKQRFFNPYLIGQLTLIQYNATEYNGPGSFKPDGEIWRERSGIAPGVSFGAGLNYYMNNRVSLTAEVIGTAAFNDELDAHKEWDDRAGNIHQTDGNDFFYVATVGITYLFDDSQWKNSPKYNRKAYLKTRSLFKKSTKKYRRPKKRTKSRRYKR
ncbi:hypothetical protein SAMN06265379_102227 [Saccharicrinis carchari]|uniref:Outer membrane protein beta-barrel domain-containing protein n=2 Tax=Saccharicrinis carchari TaxID=1168039 RepID=A0A521BYK7_SACCC|nr:hypothetical protein SAMN06265379_102227 [Saccharicrinis carchari]